MRIPTRTDAKIKNPDLLYPMMFGKNWDQYLKSQFIKKPLKKPLKTEIFLLLAKNKVISMLL